MWIVKATCNELLSLLTSQYFTIKYIFKILIIIGVNLKACSFNSFIYLLYEETLDIHVHGGHHYVLNNINFTLKVWIMYFVRSALYNVIIYSLITILFEISGD
jgi:hypothetical protein